MGSCPTNLKSALSQLPFAMPSYLKAVQGVALPVNFLLHSLSIVIVELYREENGKKLELIGCDPHHLRLYLLLTSVMSTLSVLMGNHQHWTA